MFCIHRTNPFPDWHTGRQLLMLLKHLKTLWVMSEKLLKRVFSLFPTMLSTLFKFIPCTISNVTLVSQEVFQAENSGRVKPGKNSDPR